MSQHNRDQNPSDEELLEEVEALGYWMASFFVVTAFVRSLLGAIIAL